MQHYLDTVALKAELSRLRSWPIAITYEQQTARMHEAATLLWLLDFEPSVGNARYWRDRWAMSFMGQNETIEPFDPENKDDKIACEFIEDIRENCENWREGCLHLAQGHIWPVSGCEKIFQSVVPVGNDFYLIYVLHVTG